MRSRLTAVAATAALVAVPALAVVASGGAATADNDGRVCPTFGLAEHQKPVGQVISWEIKAPTGYVIAEYCVKSANEAPFQTLVAGGKTELVIESHSTNNHGIKQAISHYSVRYEPAGGTTPSNPTTTTPSSPTTTAPSNPTTTAPSDPTTTTPAVTPTGTTSPTPNPPATDSSGGFDWNWRYADPTCTALNVSYPSNIPAGQSNDINVRVWTDAAGEVTLNFHNNEGTWSGNWSFVYDQHRSWPAGVTRYAVIWTQVAGSNYHYGEKFHQEPAKAPLTCRVTDDGDAETYDVPLAESSIAGFNTATATVARGAAARPDLVTVGQPGLEQLELQKQVGTAWRTVRAITPGARSTTVGFPRETRRGTSRYRLVLPGSESVTGATSRTFSVRVR